MRVTPGLISARVAADLQRTLAALSRQQGFIASGRRINAPSDDPGGAAQALVTRSRQAANAQFQKNVSEARGTLESADSVLRSIVATASQAHERAIQGANDTNDALSRQAIGTEVDQLLEALVSLANSRGPRGTMLFGGQESTVAPYTVTRDVAGQITAVTPNARGIDDDVAAEVAEGLTVATSVSGTTIFGASADATYAFQVLIDLRDALNTDDTAAIDASLDSLGAVIDRATEASTIVGTRLGWIAGIDERLQDESVTLASSLSRTEDLDFAKAISELNQIQMFYEAGMAAGARLLQQSLLNFLK
jgi:flagellar hook-associated protein 3 FlgL